MGQDLRTGEMVPLDPKEFTKESVQEAFDRVVSREHQGPIFTVGEELEIRGGRFRVHAISSKRIYLDSIPGK